MTDNEQCRADVLRLIVDAGSRGLPEEVVEAAAFACPPAGVQVAVLQLIAERRIRRVGGLLVAIP